MNNSNISLHVFIFHWKKVRRQSNRSAGRIIFTWLALLKQFPVFWTLEFHEWWKAWKVNKCKHVDCRPKKTNQIPSAVKKWETRHEQLRLTDDPQAAQLENRWTRSFAFLLSWLKGRVWTKSKGVRGELSGKSKAAEVVFFCVTRVETVRQSSEWIVTDRLVLVLDRPVLKEMHVQSFVTPLSRLLLSQWAPTFWEVAMT